VRRHPVRAATRFDELTSSQQHDHLGPAGSVSTGRDGGAAGDRPVLAVHHFRAGRGRARGRFDAAFSAHLPGPCPGHRSRRPRRHRPRHQLPQPGQRTPVEADHHRRALAEVTDSSSLPGFSATCTVYLPVDLATGQAIDIDASDATNASTDACSTARTIAAGAVTQLGQTAVAATLPLAGWDACSALGTTTGLVTVTSLDYCLATNSPNQPVLTFSYDRPPGPTGDTFNATPITGGSRQGWAACPGSTR
jgi:hypothetical protein